MVSRITPQAIRKLHIYDDSSARFTSNRGRVSRAQYVIDLLRVAGSLRFLVPAAVQTKVDTLFIDLYMLWNDSRDDSIDDNVD